MQLINGTIMLDEENVAFSNATVYIRIEDVTLQDASSQLISQVKLSNINYDYRLGDQGIEFSINDNNLEYSPNNMYSIFVHVDIDNNGEISLGDFVTVQSYPVVAHDPSNKMTIMVTKIK